VPVTRTRVQAEWSHHCSACGKCCNSPPELSVPELLHHQHTFFGCLAIRRLPRPPRSDAARCAEFDRLAAKLWHRLPGAGERRDDVLLATRAFDLGLSPRCPALDDEQRCALHENQKPVICQVVPLDPLQPDSEQHHVLAARSAEALVFGGNCIFPGERSGFELVTRRLTVVSDGARAALAARREQLTDERSAWGDRVFRMLYEDLFSSPSALERLPTSGFMTLSLAPVLIALLEQGELSRARCAAYLDAQAVLAERMLCAATDSGHSRADSVRRLAAFARTNTELRLRLKDD